MTDHVTQVASPAELQNADSFEQPSPKDEGSQINLLDLFETLKRGKGAIFKIALGVGLATGMIAFRLPNKYTSVASFVPPSGGGSSAASLVGQLSSLGPASLLGGVKSSGDLYAGILKSRSIAEELIKRFNLEKVYGVNHESDAVNILGANTAITVGLKDSIITIEVTDKNPQLACDLANGYLDALRETNGRMALTEASQRRLFFDQQLDKEKDNLADAEVNLKQGEEQSGLIAPIGQTTLQLQTIEKTRAEIAARQVELSDLRQSSTEQNPMVVRLHGVIADLQGQLARLQEGSDNKDSGNIPTSKVPAAQLDYIRREREVKYHEALFEMIAKQDEAARMDEARDAPLLQVLDRASYPDRKTGPHRSLITLGGLLLGILIGSVWVLARKYLQSASTLFILSEDVPAIAKSNK